MQTNVKAASPAQDAASGGDRCAVSLRANDTTARQSGASCDCDNGMRWTFNGECYPCPFCTGGRAMAAAQECAEWHDTVYKPVEDAVLTGRISSVSAEAIMQQSLRTFAWRYFQARAQSAEFMRMAAAEACLYEHEPEEFDEFEAYVAVAEYEMRRSAEFGATLAAIGLAAMGVA